MSLHQGSADHSAAQRDAGPTRYVTKCIGTLHTTQSCTKYAHPPPASVACTSNRNLPSAALLNAANRHTSNRHHTAQGLEITLRGITNGGNDISTDAFRAVAIDLFKTCGAAVDMKVKQRAVGPDGRGVVTLNVPHITHIERPISLTDEGIVKRIRGVAWTCRMPPAFSHQLLSSAKGVLLKLLADVTIFSDVVNTPEVRVPLHCAARVLVGVLVGEWTQHPSGAHCGAQS